jgi:hypothetical protein
MEANGIEKDRTSLKIAGDFNYDEKQGEYTPNLDTILHGWCQPQCDGTSLSSPTGWHEFEAGPFSLSAPMEWEFHQLQGADSYVSEFVECLGKRCRNRLTFCAGRYSKTTLKCASNLLFCIIRGHKIRRI